MTYLKAAELETGDKFQYNGREWRKISNCGGLEVCAETVEKDGTITQCCIGNMEEVSI